MSNNNLYQNQVEEQHEIINNISVENKEFKRTSHPDAQWFPEAGLGFFIHWSINSVWGMGDLSWPMMKSLPEDRVDGWWEHETCFCNGGWGYIDNEIHNPAGWFLEIMAKTRCWNGNFLPSTGPDGDGEMPEIYYKRMKQISNWMKHSAESVFDVKGIAYPEQSNVPVTKRGNKWYVHVHWLHDYPVEIKTKCTPVSVKLLRTGDEIAIAKDEGKIVFTIPVQLRTNLNDVVEIEWPDGGTPE